MSKPSMVTWAARMRTTLPVPEPTSSGPAGADQGERTVDQQVALVGARGHHDAVAGLCAVDQELQG